MFYQSALMGCRISSFISFLSLQLNEFLQSEINEKLSSVQKITYIAAIVDKEIVTVFRRRIQSCCNIQDGVFCVNSYWLPAVTYYHKALHLGCCSNPKSTSVFCVSEVLCSPPKSAAQIKQSLELGSIFSWNPQKKEKKLTNIYM